MGFCWPGMDLSTITVAFAVSGILVIFLCTRSVCAKIRHEEPAPASSFHSRTDIEQPEPQSTNGLKPVLLASIKTWVFKHDKFPSMEDAQCSICLGEYEDEEVLRIMPKCGHDFHIFCIDKWLMSHATCPVCRHPLQDLSDPKNATFTTPRLIMTENMELGR